MNFERAKEWGSLGLILMVICGFCGYKYASVDTYYASQWRDAMNSKPLLNVDTEFSKTPITSPKGASPTFFFQQCEKDYNGVQKLDCILEHQNDNLAFSYMVKTSKGEKNFADVLINSREKVDKDYSADREYIVKQVRQIAHDAGMNPDDIKSPVTTKENVVLWLQDNNAGVWLAIGGAIGFLMCVPFLWLGFWRVAGAAYRSAKKEMKGE